MKYIIISICLMITACSTDSGAKKTLDCFSIIGVAPMCQPGSKLVDLDNMGNGLYKVICCKDESL